VDACTHLRALPDTDASARGGLASAARVPVALDALILTSVAQARRSCNTALDAGRPVASLEAAAVKPDSSASTALDCLQEARPSASCTDGHMLPSGSRACSFAILALSGAAAVDMHGLTSQPLRSAASPSLLRADVPRAWRSELLYEQQWHAAQPAELRQAPRSARGSGSAGAAWRPGRQAGPPEQRGSRRAALHAGSGAAQAARACCALARQAREGALPAALHTRAAQAAGGPAGSTARPVLKQCRQELQVWTGRCGAGAGAGRHEADAAGAAVWGVVRALLAEEPGRARAVADADPYAVACRRAGDAQTEVVRSGCSFAARCGCHEFTQASWTLSRVTCMHCTQRDFVVLCAGCWPRSCPQLSSRLHAQRQ
jgi:hypothetical protein